MLLANGPIAINVERIEVSLQVKEFLIVLSYDG